MECPKCGAEISKGAMVCPNCKKVLKIVCPICKTVNEKNICKKCGEILVVKCYNCGKINMTKNKQCVKCGYPTEISAIQNESNTDTFAVVKIDFPNFDVIRNVLGSNQLFTKFKKNVDKLILSTIAGRKTRRQILKNGTYLLRFNKTYTMSSSANSAIETVIALANKFTELNVKLIDKKNVFLKANFTIMKREADKDPYDITTGFQANMLTQSEDTSKRALDSCQVITDDDFEEYYSKNYKLESLDSALVNGELKRFFEINIKEYIKIDDYIKEVYTENEEGSQELPQFIHEGMLAQDKLVEKSNEEINETAGEDLYNLDLINFDEINCSFYTTENAKILDKITSIIPYKPHGIIAIKGSNIYQPYTLRMLSVLSEMGIYQNIIPITCHDNMKYSPYSFFRSLISTIFDFTISQKLSSSNDFSAFANFDTDNLLKDLINLKQREMNENLEETREKYFEEFLALLQSIPDTVIYIENFEKIDSSSMYVLGLMFEHFEEMNVSFIISHDKSFSLHKYNHFLLSKSFYTEISLVPSSFENIISEDKEFYKNIRNDFFFRRIAKYAAGSILFFDYAIQYLAESGIYEITDSSIELKNEKTAILPSNLDLLVQRRLNIMKDDKDSFKLLSMGALLGPRVDRKTVESFEIKNWQEIAENLAQRGFLYFYNDNIYFPNYLILRKNVIAVYNKTKLKELVTELFNKVYVQNMPAPEKAGIYAILDKHKEVISEWEKLANLDLSMGDISAYLNCSAQLLKSLDKYTKDWNSEDLEQYKSVIYENISKNMFEYNPEQTRDVADKALEDLQKTQDVESFTELCTKMIPGALNNGDYIYALGLTHKILSTMDRVSIDPTAPNFNLKFLLMSIIHIKILFGVGAFNDCVDIAYNIMNILDEPKLDMMEYAYVSKENFKGLLAESLGYAMISDTLTMREDVGEFLNITIKLYDFIPEEYKIFLKLQDFIRGREVSVEESDKGQDIFSNIIYYIIKAFTEYKNNPSELAKEIYKAKLAAKESLLYPFELFSDLIIGYSYCELKSYKKALSILTEVVKSAKTKGLNAIMFAGLYLLSLLHMKQGKFDIAYGILNNSSIQMEKLGGISDYLMLLNKFAMYKLMKCMNVEDKANICLNQAKYIIQKYGLNFDTDFNVDEFMAENNLTRENQQEQNTEISE